MNHGFRIPHMDSDMVGGPLLRTSGQGWGNVHTCDMAGLTDRRSRSQQARAGSKPDIKNMLSNLQPRALHHTIQNTLVDGLKGLLGR